MQRDDETEIEVGGGGGGGYQERAIIEPGRDIQ